MAERQLLESFSRMLPELLRFSSASHLLSTIPESLQAHHRVVRGEAALESVAEPVQRTVGRAGKHLQRKAQAPTKQTSLWDGWGDAEDGHGQKDEQEEDEQEEDLDLAALGL